MDRSASVGILLLLSCIACRVHGEDPYLYFTWNVTFGTISPLGIPQQGILINGQFPGPNLNTTTNDNVVINVFNALNEPLLFTWYTLIEIARSVQILHLILQNKEAGEKIERLSQIFEMGRRLEFEQKEFEEYAFCFPILEKNLENLLEKLLQNVVLLAGTGYNTGRTRGRME